MFIMNHDDALKKYNNELKINYILDIESFVYLECGNIQNIETIDDLINWFDVFKNKVEDHLKSHNLNRDEISIQYQAIGLSMIFNITDMSFNKTFLDKLERKNRREIAQLLEFGHMLRQFAVFKYEDFYEEIK